VDTAYRDYRLRLAVWLLALAVSGLLLPRAAGEEFTRVLGTAGLTKGDLGLVLLRCEVDAACTLEDTGPVTVVHEAATTYRFVGLPSVLAGDDVYYTLEWTVPGQPPDGERWPLGTRTPGRVSAPVTYAIPFQPVIRAGDTDSDPEVRVTGLAFDPGGATATFDLVDSAGAEVLDHVAAAIVPESIGQAVDGTWRIAIYHPWTALETAGLAPGPGPSTYTGRFRVIWPGGDIQTLPLPTAANPRPLRIVVHP